MKISIIVISKNEKGLRNTLEALTSHVLLEVIPTHYSVEVVVVDASSGKLDDIAESFPNVRWIPFSTPSGVRVSIPHQRNCGIKSTDGEIIVFIDACCIPYPGWLRNLTQPLIDGDERMTCGPSSKMKNVFSPERGSKIPRYVHEAPTINLAFTRELANEVGSFDETFEYGSDVDYTRRVVASGTKIRYVSDAVVEHDWGSTWRQLNRSRKYGAARIRLAAKYSDGLLSQARQEPVPMLYAVFIVGLPLALRFRSYLLLLAVPLWRARKRPFPLRVVIFHLAEGIGGLQELLAISLRAISSSPSTLDEH